MKTFLFCMLLAMITSCKSSRKGGSTEATTSDFHSDKKFTESSNNGNSVIEKSETLNNADVEKAPKNY